MTVIRTLTEAGPLLAALRSGAPMGFDTESSGPLLITGTSKGKKKRMINMHRSTTTGMSFAWYDDGPTVASCYVPIHHNEGNASTHVVSAVLDALMTRTGETWIHGLKHELHALRRLGEKRDNVRFRCSLLAAWLVGLVSDTEANPLGLKALAGTYLGMDMASFEETFGGRQVCEVPPEEVDAYACDDAIAALRLGEGKLRRSLDKYDQWPVFLDQELPFVRVLLDMEIRGMAFDSEGAVALGNQLQVRAWELEERWAKLIPGVSITSPKQLADFFYGPTKLVKDSGPRSKRLRLVQEDPKAFWSVEGLTPTEAGKAPTNADAIKVHALRAKGFAKEAAELLLEHRAIDKLITTYCFGLPALAAQYPDGRLHPSILQHGTRTGRISMAAPNLMNVPARTELGRKVKALFLAAPGFKLLSADYSQIELRILAHLSKDPLLLDVYRRGGDIHQQTSDFVGCDRKGAKVVNFAKIYGAGNAKLALKIGCSERQAAQYMDTYLDKYARVLPFLEECDAKARRRGYAKTMGGRIRLVPDIRLNGDTESERMARARAQRKARNTPIQGSAGDIVKRAMIALHNQGCRIVNQVHDEILLEEPEELAVERAAILTATMEGIVKLRVPLVAETRVLDQWSE